MSTIGDGVLSTTLKTLRKMPALFRAGIKFVLRVAGEDFLPTGSSPYNPAHGYRFRRPLSSLRYNAPFCVAKIFVQCNNNNKHNNCQAECEMMAKKGLLDDEVEVLDKKQLIEAILVEAGDDHGKNLPKLRWLPLRRYLQKVLWSLSMPELKAWGKTDSLKLLLELDKRNQAREKKG